ncbi:HbrB-like-domain-containing protein [Aspergillus oleicola]
MLRSPVTVSPERSASRSPLPPPPLPGPRHSLDDVNDDFDRDRPSSSGSDASSVISNATAISAFPPRTSTSSPRSALRTPPSISNNSNNSTSTNTGAPTGRRHPGNFSPMPHHDPSSRKPSGRAAPLDLHKRSRHHSQGFFEPSLPTASLSDATLSASRIAAQAAMQSQHSPAANLPAGSRRTVHGHGGDDDDRSISPPPPIPASVLPARPGSAGQAFAGSTAGHGVNQAAATTAANHVFPRMPPPGMEAVVSEREHKKGEKSKMKLFSKPKHIGISRDKDVKDKGLPSPNKLPALTRIVSASTTSLADTYPSNNSSMYSLSNASASTVVPVDKPPLPEKEKEKEKDKAHRHHHFLSRQKLKLKDLKDRDEHFNLPLSSAASNSRPSDPNAPQSLYSFTPASPSATTTSFSKSVGGLDLLHGGRALRDKKKEEKALAEAEQPEWLANSTLAAASSGFAGPSSLGSTGGILAEAALRETLQGFGLHNMSPEDAWDFLKAKLLVIFDGEDVRIAIEDLNKLVLIHIQRCVQRRTPTAIVDDLRELLEAGFATLNHTLNGVPDEKLVPHLVQIWMLVFGTILPFIQAVFLPLDLEFKGCGSVMNMREAKDFWAIALDGEYPGCELEVRNLVLIAFRDMVIINRYDSLKATFSRLSLDSIKLGNSALSVTTKSSNNSNNTNNNNTNAGRPATSASADGGFGSYSSQSSNYLNTSTSLSSSDSPSHTNTNTRSRATSNTSSNPDALIFQSFSSPPTRPTIIHRSNAAANAADSSHVITETVGRMLQCVSVLAAVQTRDGSQERIETLSKDLKHNWLGRGRTGRDRRGFVGTKSRPVIVTRTESDESTFSVSRGGMSGLGDGFGLQREMSVL